MRFYGDLLSAEKDMRLIVLLVIRDDGEIAIAPESKADEVKALRAKRLQTDHVLRCSISLLIGPRCYRGSKQRDLSF